MLSPRFLIRQTCQFNHEISFILFGMIQRDGCTGHRCIAKQCGDMRRMLISYSSGVVTCHIVPSSDPMRDDLSTCLARVWPAWSKSCLTTSTILPTEQVRQSPLLILSAVSSIKLMISVADPNYKTHPLLVIQIFSPSLSIPSCLRLGRQSGLELITPDEYWKINFNLIIFRQIYHYL